MIGGHAVSHHSQPRATKDLDVLIRSDLNNAQRVFAALVAYGAPLADMSIADFHGDPDAIFQIGVEPNRVDVLQGISAVHFQEAWQRRVDASLDGTPAHFVSREDLIANKLASGRLRDLADVEAIREAQASE